MKQLLLMVAVMSVLHPLSSLAAFPPVPARQTTQTTCYDDGTAYYSYNIPCTGTGQDGELQMGVPTTPTRFTFYSDQTVFDNQTKLTWSRDANPGVTAN